MRIATSLFALVALLAAACGEGEGDTGGGTDGCKETEVEVSYIGGTDERTECQPIPSECGGAASCSDQACQSALYGLCESPYLGVGCSDTTAPTIVSCNP